MDEKNKTVAVFVDADNLLNQKNALKVVIKKAKEYGAVPHRLVYGSNDKLQEVRGALWEEAAIGIPVFRPIEGKKIADAVMLVSITQYLYEYPDIDVFLIASADSDFIVLATLLRNKGKTVVFIGNKQSVPIYQRSCHDFFCIENLLPAKDKKQHPKSKSVSLNPQKQYTQEELLKDTELIEILYSVYSSEKDNDGWGHLSSIGNGIGVGYKKKYGFKTLSLLIKETNLFNIGTGGKANRFKPKPEKGVDKYW